jgi:hypothetical protein
MHAPQPSPLCFNRDEVFRKTERSQLTRRHDTVLNGRTISQPPELPGGPPLFLPHTE